MRGRILLVLIAGALFMAAPASAQSSSFRAGPLSASVEHEPFAITFTDRKSGRRLRTLTGAPGPEIDRYGPLGYSFDLRIPVVNNAFFGYYVAGEVQTVWFHATRVVSAERRGRRLELIAETNDPLGHRLAITISRVAPGGIRVHSRLEPGSGPLVGLASISGAAFRSEDRERFIGFGERSNESDQTGNEVFNWTEEGPFSSGIGEPLLRELLPEFTFPTGPSATNFPVPWLISTRGFGFLIDQDFRSRFRLRSDRRDAWQAETETGEFRFTVFAGPRPADALRRYSGWVGRQPRPAPWIFGPWFQPAGESERFELADRFRREDVPITVAQTYTHYLPCGAHVGRRDDQREVTVGYHERGYKITTYFNPHVCTDYQPVYDDLAERGLFVKTNSGDPYVLSNPFTADELVSEFDFTNPEAERAFQGLLDEAIDDGYDGWMEDFGEYTPTNSRFANGKGGFAMHNRYPVIYHRASTRQTRRRMGRDAAVFVRSGWHGIQPHARVVWGGDPTEDWSCSDGLCAALNQALSIGASGIAYQGSDIGGFHAVVNGRTDPELNIRWLELGAFSGVMRTQANGYSFFDNRADRSQVWDEEVLPVWRRYAKLRTQLLPYVEGASRRYQRTGLPLTRHMALAFPGDPVAVRRGDQMLFGDDLLVAPVIEEGGRERELYLPRGRWVDLWRSARYLEGPGKLRLTQARTLKGGRSVRVPAPLEQIPVMVRAGSVIPMLPADVDSLANVGAGAGLVSLGDRRRRLRLLAFPRGRSRSALGRRGSVRTAERRGRLELRIRDRARRRYLVAASLATLRRPFRPCSVHFDGRRLRGSGWRWRARARAVEVSVRGRGGRLVIRGCR